MIEFARRFDQWTRTRPGWWWPGGLVALGVAAWSASLILYPVGEFAFFAGDRLGETCKFIELTGKPCPNCGMTRAFLWSARLDLFRAFRYNPAGAALFWWITAGAVVGAVRLVKRDPKALQPPWQLLLGGALLWVLGGYVALYAARLAGFNALP